jgi:hypothetical protein
VTILSWEDVLLGLVGGLCLALFLMAVFATGLWVMGKQRRWRRFESLAMLQDWADEHGYTILANEPEPFWYTPFLVSSGPVVYRVVVEDGRGQRRRGRALCGGFLLGLLSRRVAVRWEEPEDAVAPVSARDEPLWDEELDA